VNTVRSVFGVRLKRPLWRKPGANAGLNTVLAQAKSILSK
jgi:hypothetical protein